MKRILEGLKRSEDTMKVNRKYLEELRIFSEKEMLKDRCNRKCPVCGMKKETPLFNAPVYTFVQCKNCSMVYANPVLSIDANDKFYKSNEIYRKCIQYGLETVKNKRNVPVYAKSIYFILSNVKNKDKLLDIGCGMGKFLHEISFFFKSVEGIEPNKEDAEIAKTVFGLNIHTASFKEIKYPSDYFDCITMDQVIEHIIEIEPFMEEVSRILKPNGILFVACPNFNSLSMDVFKEKHTHVSTNGHVNMFDNGSLAKLGKRFGLKLEKTQTYVLDITIIDLVSFIFDRNFVHRETFHKIIYPVSWVGNKILNQLPLFGKGSYVRAIFIKDKNRGL